METVEVYFFPTSQHHGVWHFNKAAKSIWFKVSRFYDHTEKSVQKSEVLAACLKFCSPYLVLWVELNSGEKYCRPS